MTESRSIPIRLKNGGVSEVLADFTPRANPMAWEGEEPASGVFVGGDHPLEALDLLGVPGMALPEVARLPDDFDPGPRLRDWLDRLSCALRTAGTGAPGALLPIDELEAVDQQAILEILGEGEVSGTVTLDKRAYTITEATLAGVWRIESDEGAAWIEVGCIPGIVEQAAGSLAAAPFEVPANVAGTMNAPAVLAEISDRAAARRNEGPGRERESADNHVLNFTLLPMSPADHELLTTVLGRARLELRSSGFGDCEVMATRYRHVWAVQYVNAMGHVILDTVEIGTVPPAVSAAREDLEDSARRLDDILEAYL